MLSNRLVLSAARTLRVSTSASSPLLAPALRTSSRFSGRYAARRSVQLPFHAAFSTKKDDESYGLPPLQTVEDLIAENEALKKKVAELEEKITKAKPGFMATMKQYGMPFFLWWTGLYLMSGVGFYVAFDTGLLDGAQVIDFVMSIGLDKVIDPERLDPKHGNLALAIIVNEAAEALRFPFAIATIPMVKRVFSKDTESK
jgi:hypothetical protein